jgi:hypothetical protein
LVICALPFFIYLKLKKGEARRARFLILILRIKIRKSEEILILLNIITCYATHPLGIRRYGLPLPSLPAFGRDGWRR